MLVVLVDIHVKPECVEQFRAVTLDNARHSLLEPGVARFDVLADSVDPNHFFLVEAYRNPEAPAAHKGTAHYQRWKQAVDPMMAEPRRSVKTFALHPDDAGW